jgi:hypothetical protein
MRIIKPLLSIVALISIQMLFAKEAPLKLSRVKLSDKYGIVNEKGKLIVPCIYDHLEINCGPLILVSQNSKFGYLNHKGKIEIPITFENALPYYEGLAAVKKNNRYGFINKKGKVIIDFIYDDAFSFHEGLAAVKINGLWGYIDPNNNLAIKNEFETPGYFNNGLVIVRKNNLVGLIDKSGTVQIPLTNIGLMYSEKDFLAIRDSISPDGTHNLIYQLINPLNHTLTNENYKALEIKLTFISYLIPCESKINEDGFYIYEKLNGSKGVIKNTGEEIFCCSQDLERAGPGYYKYCIKDSNYFCKYGIIDQSGKKVIAPNYQDVGNYSEGIFPVLQNELWGYVEPSDKLKIEYRFQSASSFKNGKALVVENNLLNLIDTTGKIVAGDLPYDKEFDQYPPLFHRTLINVRKNNKHGAIDYNGKEIIPTIYDLPIDFRLYGVFNY